MADRGRKPGRPSAYKGRLLVLAGCVLLMLACNMAQAQRDLQASDCAAEGFSYRLDGQFIPIIGSPWVRVENYLYLQLNTKCSDAYGYGEITETQTSEGRVETGTYRISFMGERDLDTDAFEGSVYVDYDLTCAGECAGYVPYSYDYPARWTGQWSDFTINGWVDGLGDFRCDRASDITRQDFRQVEGLEIWP